MLIPSPYWIWYYSVLLLTGTYLLANLTVSFKPVRKHYRYKSEAWWRKVNRIWLNLELGKKPKHCLDYVVLHEMIHLRERHHTDRFTLTICANGGLLPVRLNEGIDPDDLPDQYVRVYREPDVGSLRDALLNDDEEVGRFATLQSRGNHLRIK